MIKAVTPRWARVALLVAVSLIYAVPTFADAGKTITAYATGAVVGQSFCDTFVVCQQSLVTGRATYIGSLTGVLDERVNVLTGEYTGTAVFTNATGDTISTDYVGQVSPPDANGVSQFVENHEVTGGTGRFAGATGHLDVTGLVRPDLTLSIVGVGVLIK